MAGPGRPHFPQSEDAVSLPELGGAGGGQGWLPVWRVARCGNLQNFGVTVLQVARYEAYFLFPSTQALALSDLAVN